MQEVPSKRKLAEADTSQQAPVFQSEVVFGIPWACKAFMQQACRVGHASIREGSVPRELVTAVDKHVEWNAEQMSWRMRNALKRHPEVAKLTKGKRLP